MSSLSGIIGIDLGTTNSCCYCLKNGKEEVVPPNEGGQLLLSAVYYQKEGNPVVGKAARGKYKSGKSVVMNSKRMIGKSYSDPSVQDILDIFGVPVICGRNDQPYLDLSGVREGMMKTAEDVATDILKCIVERGKSFTGVEFNKVCITIPSQFDNNQRTATLNALKNCGFSSSQITMISEPCAAAIAYERENARHNTHYLVFDFGGGTFDVSVVYVSDSAINVCAHRGDSNLGGITIDRMVADWMKKQYEIETGRPFPSIDMKKKNPRDIESKLLVTAEEVKIQLSSEDDTECTISVDREDLELNISRVTFNDIIRDIPRRILKVVDECVLAAGVEKKDITDIVFVGGSTRIPLIRDAVKAHFPNGTEMKHDIDQDLCVAKGAVQSFLTNLKVLDRASFSFGHVVNGAQVECIVPIDTKLPALVTMEKNTGNEDDFIRVPLCQGHATKAKQREILSDCISLGNYIIDLEDLDLDPEELKNRVLEITYKISGVIHVSVLDKASGVYLLKDKAIEYGRK